MSDNQQVIDSACTYNITQELDGTRLDKALASMCDNLSRTRIKALILEGDVSVNNTIIFDPSSTVHESDSVVIEIPPLEEALPQAEDIPLDIIYEDQDLIVINKQVGMVVHPGAGNTTGTLVNALLHYCGDSLSGIGGVARPGIVHRLDKDTSGLLIVAKHDGAHRHLTEQLSSRSLSRSYTAYVWKVPSLVKGKIVQPLGRHRTNRLKMCVRGDGKEAITTYDVIEPYHNTMACKIECHLKTGRTHQIRVHMAHMGNPLIGDPLYGLPGQEAHVQLNKAGYEEEDSRKILSFGRQALHASRIKFVHPASGDSLSFDSALPQDLENLENKLKSIS